jgi:hypothetical protein
VQPALEVAAVELALGERDIGVGADVVDGVDLAVLGVRTIAMAAVDLGLDRTDRWELVEPADGDGSTCVRCGRALMR